MATLWAYLSNTRNGHEQGDYELVSSPRIGSNAPSYNSSKWPRKKLIIVLSGAGFLLTLLVGGTVTDHPVKTKALAAIKSVAGQWAGGPTSATSPEGSIIDPQFYLRATAGGRFRDALRPDLRYMTTFHYGGMSNDFEQWCNLVYLAMISHHIPIIPPFEPSSNHIGKGGFTRNFGEIFDVPRMAALLNYPVLEWADVKRARYSQLRDSGLPPLEGVEIEDVGCWSLFQTLTPGHRPLRESLATSFLYLNITWSPVPEFVRLAPKSDFGSMTALAHLSLPESRKDVLKSPELANVTRLPDDQLTCFDALYYTGFQQTFEWERLVCVVWDLVGTNVHFTPQVESLADEYLMRLFNLDADDTAAIPLFIPVHIRRSDFKLRCPKDKPMEDCMPPLAAYERRVNQVHEELIKLFGADSPQAAASLNVIVSSDEEDPAWWESVKAKGWLYIDHDKEKTAERYGAWYLTIIDSAIHSRGAGFVGTMSSTYSLLGAKRVHDWNGGPSKMVFYGHGEDEKHPRRNGRDSEGDYDWLE